VDIRVEGQDSMVLRQEVNPETCCSQALNETAGTINIKRYLRGTALVARAVTLR
jgi:hypothetical protein